MKTYIINVLVSVTAVIYAVNAVPQQQNFRQRRPNQNDDQSIEEKIEGIFAPPSSTENNRGAGAVVTPDPNYIPTQSPQMLTLNEQNCTCVPYHMCDPTTNTVKNQENDDAITGFGVIDIRFDPLDCQDVLDVCCVGAATREEPIVPQPMKNVTTQEAGCGVRNVGGLDFELAGAFVCILCMVYRFELLDD